MQKINSIYSRLEKISKTEEIEKSGIPMGHDDHSIYLDCKEAHTAVIGSTGSGKTQAIVLPTIKTAMLAGESFVLMDTNGELYRRLGTELDKRGYKPYIINFDNPNEGNNWNPLLFPYDLYKNNNQDEAVKVLEKIARIIFKGTIEERDPFWSNAAADLFTGLTLYLFDNAKREEINFNSIYNLSIDLEETEDNVTYATKLMQNINPTSPAAVNLSNTLLAPTETRGGILAVFKQRLRYIVSRQNLSSMLSASDFSLEEITNDKVAIFIVGETIDHAAYLASILIEELYEAVCIHGQLKQRLNIILDNFAELKPIQNFHNILSRSRSLNIRFTMLIDSTTSLKQTYGNNETTLIANSISNIIYLLSTDDQTVDYISRLTEGELSPKEIKSLSMFEAIVFMTREEPFKTNLIPDFQIPWKFSEEEKSLPARKAKDIKIYNIKECK